VCETMTLRESDGNDDNEKSERDVNDPDVERYER